MYTRSRRARASLQLSLWADAVAGSARNLQRRREMGWKYREGAGQSTAAMYAAEQAERRRRMNRRKTQAITAAIVVGVTVPAWAVVNAVSTPSAHNGLATVSDGTPLGASTTASSDDQFAQVFSEAGQAGTSDARRDAAWARTVSAAHQFDLLGADSGTAPAQSAPAAPTKPAVTPDAPASVPDDLPDDEVVAPDEIDTLPGHDSSAAAPDEDATTPASTVTAPDRSDSVPSSVLPSHRESLDRDGRFRGERKHESRSTDTTKPALPAAPAAPAAPSAGAADPADPARNAPGTAQTPAKPAGPTSGSDSTTTPADSGKPTVADPAAPAADEPAAPAGESGGGATMGEGKAFGRHGHGHGHVAKSDPAAP